MVADVGDLAIALPVDGGLVRAAGLQIAVPDECHVARLGLVLCGQSGAKCNNQRRNCEMPTSHVALPYEV